MKNIIKPLLLSFKAVKVRPAFLTIFLCLSFLILTMAFFLLNILGWFHSFSQIFQLKDLMVMSLSFIYLLAFIFSGIPGRSFWVFQFLGVVVFLFLLILWFLNGPCLHGSDSSLFYFEGTFSCAFKMLGMVFMMMLVLLYFRTYFVFLNRSLSAFFLVSSLSAMAWWVLRQHCYVMDYMHRLIWHIFPIFIFVLLALFFGKRLFKKL